MKLRVVFISCISALIFTAATSFAGSNKIATPSLAQWITNNTDFYSSVKPSKNTTAASVNIPIDHYQIKSLNGKAALISIDLSQQKNTTSITWQDGVQSSLSTKKFVPLLSFIERNSLGMPVILNQSDSSKVMTANFGGIHVHDQYLNMLVYNLTENLDINTHQDLLIQIKNVN